MSELVSIVLPIYNGEKYMRQSIDSVIAQIYTNWELLIIDDGSTDRTAEIAKEYEEKDARISYHKNPQNMRLPRTLNRGFSLAKGDYLTWTSDDNLYHPEALEKMVKALQKNKNAQFAFCNCDLIDENGTWLSTQKIPSNYQDQIIGNNVVGACFMYTREVYNKIGDYDHSRILVEDFDYWQRIFANYAVVPVFETLYQYRVHQGSLTGTTKESVTNTMYEKTIRCNSMLFGKLNLAQKYYYNYALYRCQKSQGTDKYKLRYYLFKLVYYYPTRLRDKCHGYKN